MAIITQAFIIGAAIGGILIVTVDFNITAFKTIWGLLKQPSNEYTGEDSETDDTPD